MPTLPVELTEVKRVARRMAYEKLIEGHRLEEELKKKDDEHIKKVLEIFNIKIL